MVHSAWMSKEIIKPNADRDPYFGQEVSKSIGRHFFNTGGGIHLPKYSLQWRHNGRNCVSNHHPQDCLVNRLSRLRSKKTSKLRVTGLCAGNSPATGEFPAQRASNAESVSIWWRNHVNSAIRAIPHFLSFQVKPLIQMCFKWIKHSFPGLF